MSWTSNINTNKILEKEIGDYLLLSQAYKILMLSPEHPPLNVGLRRYTHNLVNELKKQGLDNYVTCDKEKDEDLLGISPDNQYNSELLLKMVGKIQLDIVHYNINLFMCYV